MVSWIISIIETIRYIGISGLMFLETYLPPVQTEILMPFAGYASFRGELNLVGAIFAGIIGSELGALSLYVIMRKADSDHAMSWIARHGKWIGIDKSKLDAWSDRFDNHSFKTVAIGRLVPGVRSFIAIPAGLQRMPLLNFALANLLGATLWISILAGGGYYLGENYQQISQYSSYFTYGFFAVLICYAIYKIAKNIQSK